MGYMFWIMCDLFCFWNGEDYLLFPNYLVVTISCNKDTLSQLHLYITGNHNKTRIEQQYTMIIKVSSNLILFLLVFLFYF